MLDAAVFLGSAGGLHRIAGAGAADQHRFLTVGGTRLGEAGIDRLVRRDIDLTEDAADLVGEGLALFGLQVEDRDLRAFRRQRPRGRRAEARGTAGDDGRSGGGEVHVSSP